MQGTSEKLILFLGGQDKNKEWDLTEHKEKRTLTQNGYYWKLLHLLAAKLKQPVPFIHNKMLRDFGFPYIINGKIVCQLIPDTDEAEFVAMQSETFHIQPTSAVVNGYRQYKVLRGCSDYNTAEMARLLDGLIEECKGQGIETMPPNELAHIRQMELEQEKKEQVKRKAEKERALQEQEEQGNRHPCRG